jgi:hypothetical protein
MPHSVRATTFLVQKDVARYFLAAKASLLAIGTVAIVLPGVTTSTDMTSIWHTSIKQQHVLPVMQSFQV